MGCDIKVKQLADARKKQALLDAEEARLEFEARTNVVEMVEEDKPKKKSKKK